MPLQLQPAVSELLNAPVRVLLAEDEPLYAEQVEALLVELGYELVGPAVSARQALGLYRQVPAIDLAILDIGLRGPTNGLELAGQLLAHAPVPIIFLTSFRDAETRRQAHAVQPAAYLTKPINQAALRSAIGQAIRHFSAQSWPGRQRVPVPPPAAAETIYVRENDLLEKVLLSDICYVVANGGSCQLRLTERSLSVPLPLLELAHQLPAALFVQIQHGCFINLTHIERLDLVRHLVQINQQLLPVEQPFVQELLGRLHTLT